MLMFAMGIGLRGLLPLPLPVWFQLWGHRRVTGFPEWNATRRRHVPKLHALQLLLYHMRMAVGEILRLLLPLEYVP